MSIEASIIEQLQELRRWQLKQQEEFIRYQVAQRQMLSNEQDRMIHALSLSIDEMSLNEKMLKNLIKGHKKGEEESDLIDLHTPDEECSSIANPKRKSFFQYSAFSKDKLTMENAGTESKLNLEYNNLFNQQDYSSEISINDLHSFSSEKKSEKLQVSIDELPVPSPKKDFNALLEERLRDAEAQNVEIKSKSVIKRPFLKKGEGLARYLPGWINKKLSKNNIRPRSASCSTVTQSTTKSSKATNLNRCNSLPRSKKNETRKSISNIAPITQQKLSLKNVLSPQKKSGKNLSLGPSPNIAKKKESTRTVTINSNIQTSDLNPRKNSSKYVNLGPSPSIAKKKEPAGTVIINPNSQTSDINSPDLETKSKRELEEVRTFELVEDKAKNSSFCSTSNTFIDFSQQSTPLKHKAHTALKSKLLFEKTENKASENIIHESTSNNLPKIQLNGFPLKQTVPNWEDIPIHKLKNNKTVTGTVLPYGTDVNLHYDEYDSDEKLNQDQNNISLHVRFSEYNEHNTMADTSSISNDSQTIKNYINDKGSWSDCLVTSDSLDMQSIISLPFLANDKSHKNNDKDNSSLLKNYFKTYKYNSYHNKSVNDENDEENVKKQEETDNKIKSKNITLQKDTVIKHKDENASLLKSELLKTRLVELEQEIEIFRKESAALIFQRQKLQEERIKLQEECLKMQRSLKEKEELLEMEKKKTESILEEKKRLVREKAALESRMKDAYEKAQKSKQERQEIQSLQYQFEELKEEYSQKESKWFATNIKQRSQMRVLQTENSKLKQKLEKLQQIKNAQFKKPVVSSNARAIHQIKRFLAERKKNSPTKTNVSCQEETKIHEATQANYNIKMNNIEEPQEKESENVNVLKSIESITRRQNLYESLSKDATENLSENCVKRKNLILEQTANGRNAEQTSDDHLGNENNFDTSANDINRNKLNNSKSPSTREESDESENNYERRDNKSKQQKFSSNKERIREIRHPDGQVEYWYPNGNVKKVFRDKGITRMIYYNGDIEETDQYGIVKYYYASTRTWHTTMPDALEIFLFPDGKVETRSEDGTVEVAFPDGSVHIIQADGSEKWTLRDGTTAETSANGEKILTLSNGQREVHTKDHKRREYPDGTVTFIYSDGTQETRYADGKIRLMDKDGNLLTDLSVSK